MANVGSATSVRGDVPPGVYHVRVRVVGACGQQGPASPEVVVTVQ